jgi:hypothetical protein
MTDKTRYYLVKVECRTAVCAGATLAAMSWQCTLASIDVIDFEKGESQ